MSKYRDKILKAADKYYKELNCSDFSHNFDHFLRVERLAKKIGDSEKADIDVLEAASLLFDVARNLEDKGKVLDHAEAGAKIARKILTGIGFPEEKIVNVCHAILVHRKSKDRSPETIEAKILQDADYLDALGVIAVIRTVASSFQSNKYKTPIYVEKPYIDDGDKNISAIHYVLYMTKHSKLQPEKFYTELGRILAKDRFEYMKEFVERFINEWSGKK